MRYIIFFVVFAFGSCSKDPSIWQVKNLHPTGDIAVFGHGGMGIKSLWPINSMESLSKCIEMGAEGTEMDVQMSKDSVLFLFHASDLSENTKCSGKIANLNSSEIKCEYKSLTPKGAQVISLRDFLNKYAFRKDLKMTFECKLAASEKTYFEAYTNRLISDLVFFGVSETCFIESTEPEFLKLLLQKKKGLHLFLYSDNVQEAINVADSLHFFGLTFNMDIVSAEQIQLAHKRNLRVTLFNQQTEADNIRAIEMQPDFIQTDKLKHLLEVTGKGN